jgi:hypothetical protein
MRIRLPTLVTAGLLTLVTIAIASFQPYPERLPIVHPSPNSITTSQFIPDKRIHPDEPIEVTIAQRFAFPTSIERLKQIRQALNSFRQLTEKSQALLEKKVIANVGYTDSETQTIGFYNWVEAVAGTLWSQNYQLKKLELALAEKQYQDGEISKSEVEAKLTAYQNATSEFEQFWKSSTVLD